ncbi:MULTISPECIES: hypothetical protein [Micrococcaceae]|uniref:hypothetical protein n=1 Tax=Micrococcaceae TaxID=1268 RepID=UPI000B308899|nr:hypothetical protein [Arthrobacter sp. Leaf137]MDQ1054626.1 hypothetical protein [Arthrobacter sp. SORGH_AS_0212]
MGDTHDNGGTRLAVTDAGDERQPRALSPVARAFKAASPWIWRLCGGAFLLFALVMVVTIFGDSWDVRTVRCDVVSAAPSTSSGGTRGSASTAGVQLETSDCGPVHYSDGVSFENRDQIASSITPGEYDFEMGWSSRVLGVEMRQIMPTARGYRVYSDWIVDGAAFGSEEDAKNAALAALRALDGTNPGALVVEYGTSRFEAVGSATVGFVCHRNSDTGNADRWSELQDFGPGAGSATGTVEVPVANGTASVAARNVHTLDRTVAAMEEFFADPTATPAAPAWVTGNLVERTRLAR